MSCKKCSGSGCSGCGSSKEVCPGDDYSPDDSSDVSCPAPTYVESRTVYTPAQCTPRVITTPEGTIATISGLACNLIQALPTGLFADVGFTPDDDGVLSFTGCGTASSPFKPTINYVALADIVSPADTTAYVTDTRCGWQWQNGKLVLMGPLVTSIKSSDSSVDVSYSPADCSFDVRMVTTSTPVASDQPAEIAIITAEAITALGAKVVNVAIRFAQSGSTGSVTVTPNAGATPAPQNYVATPGGTADMTFIIDTATTSAVIQGTNSTRILINPGLNFTIPC